MSVIFMLIALGIFLKSHESIVSQLEYGFIFLVLSPIVTLTMLVIKIFFPNWWKNLDLPSWKFGLEFAFETALTMGILGCRMSMENSKAGDWDLMFAGFALGLQFVAGAVVIGQRSHLAAQVTGCFVMVSATRSGRESGSVIDYVIGFVMYSVVFIGVRFANGELIKKGGGNGVKGGQIPVKVSQSK
ncbi:hypothetical protein M5689_005281 [Euphorbia peplus]|nr:hypothetical protein M5689_005281 [Euphorbia peplus]